jgi:hypothetical protein
MASTKVTAMRLLIGNDTVGYRFKAVRESVTEHFDVAKGFLTKEQDQFMLKESRSYNVLVQVGDKYISKKEQSGEITAVDVSEKPEVFGPLMQQMGYGASGAVSGMNPAMTDVEKDLHSKIKPLQGKHIFTKNLGDGEINKVTRKNDLSGMWVYFHSNLEGELKLDATEFLSEVDDVRPIPAN